MREPEDFNEYFNFIVIGDNPEWIECTKGTTLPKSRLFEYTTSDIEQEFSIDDSFSKIQNLPCICTCEGRDSPIFTAKIDSIFLVGNSIKFTIKDVERQSITFKNLHDRNIELIHYYEISRNHWAIKKGNLESILRNTTNNSEPSTSVEESNEVEGSREEIFEINNIVELIKCLQKVQGENREQITFYRGHSKQEYKLTPSVFRKNNDGSYSYRDIEEVIYHELLARNYPEFLDDDSTLDRLVHMQHFGLPTRLLDITSNPLIALYFACKSYSDSDGDFLIISISKENIKYFDSDTITCLVNLTKLNLSEKEKIFETIETRLEENKLKRKFLHFIRDDKPYFNDGIIADDLKKIICVKSKITNSRISAQAGAFLVFGLIEELEDKNDFGFAITHCRVDKKQKADILVELDLLNINESTVFPYLENSAKYIAQKFKNNYIK